MGGLFRLAWELLLVYLLYKFVVNFIIPLYRTTKTMGSKMQEMQEQMKKQQQQQAPPPPVQKATPPKAKEDYIEYEELP